MDIPVGFLIRQGMVFITVKMVGGYKPQITQIDINNPTQPLMTQIKNSKNISNPFNLTQLLITRISRINRKTISIFETLHVL
jgi:hypothetical protein